MSDILSEKEGEDKESRMTDTDEKESRFWIVKYLLKGLVAFVVVYGLLTLVIYVSNKTTPAPSLLLNSYSNKALIKVKNLLL